MLVKRYGKLVWVSLGGAALCLALGRCSPITPSLYRNSMRGTPTVSNPPPALTVLPAKDALKAVATLVELKSETAFEERVAISAPSKVIDLSEAALAELRAGNSVKVHFEQQPPAEITAVLAVSGLNSEMEARQALTKVLLAQEVPGEWSLRISGNEENLAELRATLRDAALICGQDAQEEL